MNQTVGAGAQEREDANAAMPTIEPAMSIA